MHSRPLPAKSLRGYAHHSSHRQKELAGVDILSEMGFDYDSSIYPVLNHRYGVPDAPREPHQIEAGGGHLTELRLSPPCRWA